LQAINPVTGKVVWTSNIGQHHWSSPIMANGIVYLADGNSGGFGSGTSGDLLAWSLG
jgi:outer membrane protein assembly factor BamB